MGERGEWGSLGKRSRDTIIFVCHLPEDMDEYSWLKQIFSGAGKIMDVYIPRKRSFRLNQRFEFVRYGNKEEGLKAIKMWNTAQIQGHRLLVKVARFNNTRWNKQGQNAGVRKVYRVVKNKNPRAKEPNRIPNSHNAPVMENRSNRFATKTRKVAQPCINVSEVGNEWLSRSAIAKLSPFRSMIYMQDHLRNLGYSNIQMVTSDILSSSSGIETSVRGSGKVRGSMGEGAEINALHSINLAPLTIIGLNQILLLPRTSLSNLVENYDSGVANSISWVANSVNENPAPTSIFSERKDEGKNADGRLDQNVVNLTDDEPILAPLKAAINGVKGKKKRKSIYDILGFTKVNSLNNKGRKNKQKCEVFRSAVAAVALSASISSGGIVNRNRIILNEAQAIWECNKIMGMGYDGDEDEVVNRFADMKAQDLDKADRAAGQL
ncbi:hypothetical protein RHGRI_001461 [Rhododendron griersonianum]|uniref:RRM domain-containing protein n=1 Tax=Rhododendron griersonianum TaxID=479676 RepID=A0AAV6LKA1_9ERIC|nr:hypothetical protein RHGRI_001461 [Rhododendron griersonianum]